MSDEELQEAIASWEKISSSPDALRAYRAQSKIALDEQAFKREMELREEAALEQGLELGGKQADEKTARNFLAMGIDVETVAKGTGLSLEEVKALKEKIDLS